MFSSKACFKTFSEKRKENESHRKYTLLVGPAENLSPPTISQIWQNCWFYFIYNGLEQSITYWFCKFLKNNFFLKQLKFFSSKNHIFWIFLVCAAYFYWKEIEYSKSGMWQSRQFNFLKNDVCFSLLGQKLWEEIHF